MTTPTKAKNASDSLLSPPPSPGTLTLPAYREHCRELSDVISQEMREYYDDGFTFQQIADLYECTFRAAYMRVRATPGFQARPVGRPAKY